MVSPGRSALLLASVILAAAPLGGVAGVSPTSAQAIARPDLLDVRAFANLSAAVADPSTAGKTILVATPQSCDNLTVPDDREISIVRGGSISIAPGKTLSLGPFRASPSLRVFPGAGRVLFRPRSGVNAVSPVWWGAYADGTHYTETADALQKAADSAADSHIPTVELASGVYAYNTPLTFHGPVKLHGASRGSSFLTAVGCDAIHLAAGYSGIEITDLTIKTPVRYSERPNAFYAVRDVGDASAKQAYHIYRNLRIDGFGTAFLFERLWNATFDTVHVVFSHVGLSTGVKDTSAIVFINDCDFEMDGSAGSMGIYWPSHVEGWSIVNSLLYGCDVSILAVSANSIYISNTQFDMIGRMGIYGHDTAADPRNFDWSITNCYFAVNKPDAEAVIRFDNNYAHIANNGSRISNNNIQTYQGTATCDYGIRFFGSHALHNIVVGNSIANMRKYDIYDQSGTGTSIMVGNNCQSKGVLSNIYSNGAVSGNIGSVRTR